ncbi:MAG: Asp-tRNA(Asn)/Glu-tRNA(Gln) amidotransferase subunit GatB [bacterium]|nr:Asp-tRNA(Asn)/Glu-tRNA(Gln) amidotransferase subunit GatB [bacterium]
MTLEPIIGLEIHVQLKTARKMFCDCANVPDATPPNTAICPICLGYPGTLPMPNKQAIEWSALTALALGCSIRSRSKFDRKHYFYPDLPKAYQISQYDEPIGEKGALKIGDHEVRLTRLHLEEDAAKLLHGEDRVQIDFNRAGTPLAEIVTEPDMRTPAEAKAFLQELREIVRSLGVSDADMEKGQLRCDVNVSLREIGKKKLSPKTEIKNVNSFRAVEHAIAYEIERQTRLWEEGSPPAHETTRGWDDEKGKSVEQRTKELAADYRYFPEPDIPPLEFSKDWIDHVAEQINELPQAKRVRFINEYALKPEDARIIVADTALADFTEHVFSELAEWRSAIGHDDEDVVKEKLAQLVSGWLLNKFLGILTKRGIALADVRITPENFAEFLMIVGDRKVNTTNALKLLEKMVETGGDPSAILEDEGLTQDVSGSELDVIVQRIIVANPDVVASVQKGKEAALQFLVGLVMRETKGKANPEAIMELLKKTV